MTTSTENDRAEVAQDTTSSTSNAYTAVKLLAAAALFYSAGVTFAETYHHTSSGARSSGSTTTTPLNDNNIIETIASDNNAYSYINWDGHGRRLTSSEISVENPPSYMKELMEDLKGRKKLMEETPPEEVKYWFEYTGPLQVSIDAHTFPHDTCCVQNVMSYVDCTKNC